MGFGQKSLIKDRQSLAKSTVKGGKLRQMQKRNGTNPAPAAVEPPPPPQEAALEGEHLAAGNSPPTPFDVEPSPAAEPAPRGPGRPPKPRNGAITNAARTILEIIRDVPSDYWRAGIATVKIFRLAPKIDRQATSEYKFMRNLQSPWTEIRILSECGSGKYSVFT